MKYILVLHICSLLTGKCFESQTTGYMFNSHYDCAVGGYQISGQTFKLFHSTFMDKYGYDQPHRSQTANACVPLA